VIVTLTAQDWAWNDTFTLQTGEERIYCLDPGTYTYTLDAPPPWGSTNGELVVNAGDRFLFPIGEG
jgi:serine protease Do